MAQTWKREGGSVCSSAAEEADGVEGGALQMLEIRGHPIMGHQALSRLAPMPRPEGEEGQALHSVDFHSGPMADFPCGLEQESPCCERQRSHL